MPVAIEDRQRKLRRPAASQTAEHDEHEQERRRISFFKEVY
jgi:hypothetical protein